MVNWNRTGYGWWKLSLGKGHLRVHTTYLLTLGTQSSARKDFKWRWCYDVHAWKDQHSNSYITARNDMIQETSECLKDMTDERLCFIRNRMMGPRKWLNDQFSTRGAWGRWNYYLLWSGKQELQNSQVGPTTNNCKNINRVGEKAYNSAYSGYSSNQTTEQNQAKRSNKEIYLYQQITWVQDTKITLLPD